MWVVAVLASVLAPAAPVTAKDFPIIFLLPPDETQDRPEALAFIDGGYLDGLQVGMEGVFTQSTEKKDNRKRWKKAKLRVRDVTAFAATCEFNHARWDDIRDDIMVTIETPNLDAGDLLRLGKEAADAGQYDAAVHYLEKLESTESFDTDSTVADLLERCRANLQTAVPIELNPEETKIERGRAPGYDMVGSYFFTHAKRDAAREYLARAVRLNPDNKHAEYLLCQIDTGVACDTNYVPPTPPEVMPEMVKQGPLDYPRSAKKRGREGLVWIKALVDETGVVIAALVSKSSGFKSLDQAALQQAYACEYKPAVQAGEPTPCWVGYRVNFKLD